LLSRWPDSREESGADVRAYRRQYSVGEAYERIGVDGKHVVLAIGVSCRQWGHTHRNRHRDEIVLLTASETAPT
jgi:hypothetical protein